MHQSFNPTVRTLMGPGPSDVNPRILVAMSKPTIGHLDPEFIRLMDEIKAMLQATFQTKKRTYYSCLSTWLGWHGNLLC